VGDQVVNQSGWSVRRPSSEDEEVVTLTAGHHGIHALGNRTSPRRVQQQHVAPSNGRRRSVVGPNSAMIWALNSFMSDIGGFLARRARIGRAPPAR